MLCTDERIPGVNWTPAWLGPAEEESVDRQALRDENAQLRARLAHAEKLAFAGTLLAGIAHELNNPLTVIKGLADMIEADNGTAGTVPSHIGKIGAEAERSVRIVRNLLHLCRPDGKGTSELDVHSEIREAVELAICGVPKDTIDVLLFLDEGTPCVLGRSGALLQTVLNLVINAAQAIQGVRSFGSIAVSSHIGGGCVRIVVRDDGPGISPKALARVFDPFYTTKASGTGMGLNLCLQTVEGMGGTIGASNDPDGGAVFTIELPLASLGQSAEPLAAYGPVAERKVEERTVLVVDDEAHIVDLVEAVLRRRGFQTSSITGPSIGAESAIETLKESNFDLVISDFHLSGSGGRKLIEWLKASGKPTRALVVSGDVLKPGTREFVENSGATFLPKPFSLAELSAAVDRVMRPAALPC